MTRIILAVLAIAFLLLFVPSGNAIADHEEAHECVIASEDQFYSTVVRKNAKMFLASENAKNTIISRINQDRKSRGLFPLEADKFVIGLFDEGGMMQVGTVAFKDRCVVPGTVSVIDARTWVSFIVSLYLSADDFTEMHNG